MIQVSGYFYDATSQQKIGGEGNYTIACMAGYEYNIAEALVRLQLLEEIADVQDWAATQYLLDAQPGGVALQYSATLPDIGLGPIQVPIVGTYTKDSFSYDYNNVLYWLKIYYEGIKRRSGETHSIRFCRSDNPDQYYLEYNYDLYPNGLVLCNDGIPGFIDNITTFPTLPPPHAVGYAPNAFLFVYSTNVESVNPSSIEPFYIGCFNMDDMENLSTLYKGSFEGVLTVEAEKTISEAGTVLASIVDRGTSNTRTFLKLNNGKAIYGFGLTTSVNNYSYASPMGIVPTTDGSTPLSGWGDGRFTDDENDSGVYEDADYPGVKWLWWSHGRQYSSYQTDLDTYGPQRTTTYSVFLNQLLHDCGVVVSSSAGASREMVYIYLKYMVQPETEVTPTDVPPATEPTNPPQPDNPDPYYDPTSDPESPSYDPTKDPESPSYEPTQPHTPYRPPSKPVHHEPEEQPPQEDIPVPVVPPAYINNNKMFTIYNPSGGDLNNIATFLWSSGWSIDSFKKILANPIDCILSLMVMPLLSAPVDTREMSVGNISTGINLHYFTTQFFDFDCGSFDIKEYYASYLDYAPYTKVSIFLPFIGESELDTDEVMNKTLSIKYRFDLATGDCVAFLLIDSSVHYQFSGNCAARLPVGGATSNAFQSLFSAAIASGSFAAGLPALGAASAISVSSMKRNISHSGSIVGSHGLMAVQTPFLIITRPRQAYPLNQNVFMGYPSFITESLSQLRGYTEVEQVHLEHIPATGDELIELERLLKEGVLF